MAITMCLVVRTLSLPTQRMLRVSWEIRVSSNPHWLYSLPLGPRRKPHCRHVTAHLHQSLANPSRKCRKALTSDTPGEAPATMCPPLLHGVRSSVLLACETERNWCFLLSPAPSWELTICCRSKSAESPSWKHEAVISIHPQKALPGKELEFGEAPDEQGVRNAGCH